MSYISLQQIKSEKNMNSSNNEVLADKNLFIKYLENGCKQEKDFKTALEFEKLAVSKADDRAVSYYGEKGIRSFLETLNQKFDWKYILENDNPLGVETPLGNITVEPGGQVEFSSLPQKNVHEIKNIIDNYNKITADIADENEMNFIGYGIQPLTTNVDIKIIPKARYSIMTEYLPTRANLPFVMMRETAGLQTVLDYSSEADCMDKLKIAMMLSPFVTAIFANSPIRNGVDTGYKSYRAYAWLNTDEDRCGLISRKIFDDREKSFSFADYTDIIFDLPMVFLEKYGDWYNMKGLSFREYSEKGFNGYKATMEDLMLHLTSFFPDVRLKHYIEIRNNDCQNNDFLYAIPALWKGLIYSIEARTSIKELLKDFTYEDFAQLRSEVPLFGLDAKIKGHKISHYAKEIILIAEKALDEMSKLNSFDISEAVYLQNIKELVYNNMTPADVILKNWYGSWNKDITKLVKYSKID